MPGFGPGVVLIAPDQEFIPGTYVPGVIMAAATGAVIGAVPSSVVFTSDGCVFNDGTMCVMKRQTPGPYFCYDTNFNQTATATLFPSGSGLGVGSAPPSPVSDFVTYAYQCDVTTKQVRRMTKAGAIDPTTWNLPVLIEAFAVSNDNTTLWYYDGSGAIRAFSLTTNSALPDLVPAASFPAPIGTGNTLRVVPGLGTLVGIVGNFSNSPATSELWQWATSGPSAGQVLTKTPLPYLIGNTDATIQPDVGFPSLLFWTRGYGGPDDRENGSTVNLVRLSDGAILTGWTQTIAEVDGGVPGGVLPATCPVYGWSATAGPSQRPGCQGFGP